MAMVTPGTIAGNLDKRVGDFARTPKAAGEEKPKKDKKKRDQSTAAILIGYAKGNGTSTDPTIRFVRGSIRIRVSLSWFATQT